MSTFGAMATRLLHETRQSTAGSGTAGNTTRGQVRYAIHQALQDLRREAYPWNVGDFTLTFAPDQDEPGQYEKNAAGASLPTKLPADFIMVLGDDLDLTPDGEDTSYRIDRVSDVYFDDQERAWKGQTSRPVLWRDREEALEFLPVPDAADVVAGRYLVDLGNVIDAAGAFESDAYTTAWFEYDKGEPLVRNLAGYYFTSSYLSPNDDNQALARQYLQRSAVQRGAETKLTREKTLPSRTMGYLGTTTGYREM